MPDGFISHIEYIQCSLYDNLIALRQLFNNSTLKVDSSPYELVAIVQKKMEFHRSPDFSPLLSEWTESRPLNIWGLNMN